MRKSIILGLFIGVTVSSTVAFFLRIIPLTPLIMMIILYLYSVVGGATAYFVHKRLEDKKERVSATKEKNHNPVFIDVGYYKSYLENMSSIKQTIIILENVLRVRKKLESLKASNQHLLELSTDRADKKSSNLIYEMFSAKTDLKK